ncbi:MAG: hypothetical protein HAW66_03145 [Shewanella sp.]|nr:hypothetical protein [Shewanella sp.]
MRAALKIEPALLHSARAATFNQGNRSYSLDSKNNGAPAISANDSKAQPTNSHSPCRTELRTMKSLAQLHHAVKSFLLNETATAEVNKEVTVDLNSAKNRMVIRKASRCDLSLSTALQFRQIPTQHSLAQLKDFGMQQCGNLSHKVNSNQQNTNQLIVLTSNDGETVIVKKPSEISKNLTDVIKEIRG